MNIVLEAMLENRNTNQVEMVKLEVGMVVTVHLHKSTYETITGRITSIDKETITFDCSKPYLS